MMSRYGLTAECLVGALQRRGASVNAWLRLLVLGDRDARRRRRRRTIAGAAVSSPPHSESSRRRGAAARRTATTAAQKSQPMPPRRPAATAATPARGQQRLQQRPLQRPWMQQRAAADERHHPRTAGMPPTPARRLEAARRGNRVQSLLQTRSRQQRCRQGRMCSEGTDGGRFAESFAGSIGSRCGSRSPVAVVATPLAHRRRLCRPLRRLAMPISCPMQWMTTSRRCDEAMAPLQKELMQLGLIKDRLRPSTLACHSLAERVRNGERRPWRRLAEIGQQINQIKTRLRALQPMRVVTAGSARKFGRVDAAHTRA